MIAVHFNDTVSYRAMGHVGHHHGDGEGNEVSKNGCYCINGTGICIKYTERATDLYAEFGALYKAILQHIFHNRPIAINTDKITRAANAGSTLHFVTRFRPYLMVKN